MSPKNSDNNFHLWTTPAWLLLRPAKIWAFCTPNIRQSSSTFFHAMLTYVPEVSCEPGVGVPVGCCPQGRPPSSTALGFFFAAAALCGRLAMCDGPGGRAHVLTKQLLRHVRFQCPRLLKGLLKNSSYQLGKSGCDGLVLVQQSFVILG